MGDVDDAINEARAIKEVNGVNANNEEYVIGIEANRPPTEMTATAWTQGTTNTTTIAAGHAYRPSELSRSTSARSSPSSPPLMEHYTISRSTSLYSRRTLPPAYQETLAHSTDSTDLNNTPHLFSTDNDKSASLHPEMFENIRAMTSTTIVDSVFNPSDLPYASTPSEETRNENERKRETIYNKLIGEYAAANRQTPFLSHPQ